ncbi:MAG TPA: HPr family phosphocarrier protein [Candidatus Limnocylindria bacterium]|nr:HPr family phosphocarrier protein [Candidatus Limnocylindria bacterium]
MPEVTLEVRNPSGLHARPAALFVKTASGFDATVSVTNLTRDPDKSAPATSLLGVLALGVSRGHRIRISAEGDDADEAIATLSELVRSGLGEEVEPEADGT